MTSGNVALNADGFGGAGTTYALSFRGREVLLLKPDTIIGRASDCDVTVESAAASRHHARVSVSPSGVTIEDLGSKNGIFVNLRPVRGRTELHPGDTVQVGDTDLKLVTRPAVPSTHPPASGIAVREK
jgi:pSer/pThr/pTyr-binding forkhead associated (FHA) protein